MNCSTTADGRSGQTTVYEVFAATASRHPRRTALLYKNSRKSYKSISYAELKDAVDRIAVSLARMGLKKGDGIAIFSYNRPKWAIADLAVMRLGGVVVPLYHALSVSTLKHEISDSGCRAIFVENAERMKMINSIRKDLPQLAHIIVFDASGIGDEDNCLKLDDLRNGALLRRETVLDRICPATESDTATIIYTSGTTGEPKGTVLSHRNIVSIALAAARKFELTPKDVFLSYLPLPHVFERICGYYTALFTGSTIGYAENISTAAKDVKKIRPTMLLAVPGVIERIYDKAVKKTVESSRIKKALLLSAVKHLNEYANLRYRKMKIPLWLRMKCAFFNAVVASRLRKIIGGRVRAIVCGGAPLDRQIAKVIYVLGFNVMEGYGLTEASAVIACNTPRNNRLGTVGRPFNDVEIRINGNGEILVRSPGIMTGYLNKPEETAEAIDGKGWLHTGDEGAFDRDGNLVITGRIKEIIVTCYGKNVSPVPLETEIVKSRYIGQAVLCGDKRKYISALIVPDRKAIESYAREKNVQALDYTELLKQEEIKKLIADEIEKATAGFSPFEKVKAFTLLPEGFTIENGLLTPTLKLRRSKIADRYRTQISNMYGQTEGRRNEKESVPHGSHGVHRKQLTEKVAAG